MFAQGIVVVRISPSSWATRSPLLRYIISRINHWFAKVEAIARLTLADHTGIKRKVWEKAQLRLYPADLVFRLP